MLFYYLNEKVIFWASIKSLNVLVLEEGGGMLYTSSIFYIICYEFINV